MSGNTATNTAINTAGRPIGDVILDVQNISLRFGGVKALSDISFDVREHELRAIIGPNGAGKSSMLNCINGVYAPQEGAITFRGQTFSHMNSRQVAELGVARTFQNLALFKGMSVVDNIMSGVDSSPPRPDRNDSSPTCRAQCCACGRWVRTRLHL